MRRISERLVEAKARLVMYQLWFISFTLYQSQNAKRASSQKRHMVISIFLPCNSLILMSIGAGSIRAIKGGSR